MAKAIVAGAAGFHYIAEIRPLARPAGHFSFSLTTRWAHARDPGHERRVAHFVADTDGLRALRGLLDGALAEPAGAAWLVRQAAAG